MGPRVSVLPYFRDLDAPPGEEAVDGQREKYQY